MTLALSLGMSIGVRNTMWMMLGELIGVAVVAISAIVGIALLMQQLPSLFIIFKIVGASYLFYLAFQLFRAHVNSSILLATPSASINKQQLFWQGLLTAIANPKGWAFMISLLPPFINQQQPLIPQLSILISIILISEFTCMMLYANGGKSIRLCMQQPDKLMLLHKISALLMALVGVWLLIS